MDKYGIQKANIYAVELYGDIYTGQKEMVASDEFCTSTAKVVDDKVELLISLPWLAPQMHRHNLSAGYLEGGP